MQLAFQWEKIQLMDNKKQVLKVFEGARNELLINGWCQNIDQKSDGSKCLLFAIEYSTPDHKWNLDASDAEDIVKAVNNIDDSSTSWNDSKRRNKKQVIEALDLGINAVMSEV
jgi:hypothetical protein